MKEFGSAVRVDGAVDATVRALEAAFVRRVRWVAPVAVVAALTASAVAGRPSWLGVAAAAIAITATAWHQHHRGRPNILVLAALASIGVGVIVATMDLAATAVPIAFAGALGVAGVFVGGRRLGGLVALAVGLWLLQAGALVAKVAAEGGDFQAHSDELVGLFAQLFVFAVFSLLFRLVLLSMRDTRELYETLFRNAPVSLWREDFGEVAVWLDHLKAGGVTDLRGLLAEHPEMIDRGIALIRVIDVNDAAAALLGVPDRQDLLGHINPMTIAPDVRPGFVEQFVAIWEGRSEIRLQTPGRSVDGHEFVASLNWAMSIRNDVPDPSDVIVTIDDISKLVAAQTEVAFGKELLDHVSDLIFTVDADGVMQFVSTSVERILGYLPAELIGRSVLDIVHPEDRRTARLSTAKTAPGGMAPRAAYRVLHKNHSWKHLEATATNLLDDETIRGWLVSARDVTQRLEAEEILRNSEERFRLLAEHSTDLISRQAPDGTYRYVSPSSQALLGYDPKELVGVNVADLCHEDDLAQLREVIQHQLNDREVKTVAYRMRRKDGEYLWMETRSKTTRHPVTDQIVDVQAASRDITERKAFEVALEEARDVAEAATIVKSQFLANMSHEIRTPMNAIVGMTELALSTELTVEQREYLGTIKAAVDALLSLINDILDLSKIEAGRLELERIPFGLGEVVEDIVRTLAVRAADKALDLSCDIAPDVPDGILGDPGRLRQVLVNLVGNALKFTHVGSVKLTVTRHDDMLRFEVADTGIGIPESKLEAIFDTFSQADGSTTRLYGGTGLGLTISRDITGAMGGEMTVTSTPGEGSVFAFTMPLVEYEWNADDAPTPGALDARSVVVISDTPAGRRNLVEMLRQGKITPIPVEDMAEAITAVDKAATGKRTPAAVIVDWQADYVAFCERVCEHSSMETLPVVVLASTGARGEAAHLRKLGAAGYLTKPVTQQELLETVRTVAAGHAATNGELVTRHWLRERRKQLRVLLVDDSATNRQLARRLLEKRHHQVTAVENGLEAVREHEKDAYDIILMDVQMPQMDGLEATALIREREALVGGRIPIVALTAHAMKGDRDRCLEAGMDAYVSKPFQADELFATVEQLVSYASAGERPQLAATVAVPEAAPTDSAIDWDDAVARLGGSPELLGEVAAIFLDCYEDLRNELDAALAGGDCATAGKRAHRLKGDLAAIGATAASQAAKEIEATAKAGDLEAAKAAHMRFAAEMQRTEPDIVTLATGLKP